MLAELKTVAEQPLTLQGHGRPLDLSRAPREGTPCSRPTAIKPPHQNGGAPKAAALGPLWPFRICCLIAAKGPLTAQQRPSRLRLESARSRPQATQVTAEEGSP